MQINNTRFTACSNDLCSLSLIGLNLGNPNPCDMTQLTAVVAPSITTGCMELYLTCPAGTSLYEILTNTNGSTSIGSTTDTLTCQVSPPAWISSAESPDQALAAYCVNCKHYQFTQKPAIDCHIVYSSHITKLQYFERFVLMCDTSTMLRMLNVIGV